MTPPTERGLFERILEFVENNTDGYGQLWNDEGLKQICAYHEQQLAEAKQDIEVLQGYLGHAVADGTPKLLSDGSKPNNALADFIKRDLEGCIARLDGVLAEAKALLASAEQCVSDEQFCRVAPEEFWDNLSESIAALTAAPQQEPESCGYQGKHFGAIYEDGGCINGYLWDLDSCDNNGENFSSGGDIPCPKCNAEEYASYFSEDEQEPK